jgi:two-component sensor histidine kinase
VRLTPKTALALAMAFHELGTNAAKYGALSAEGGHVDIVWAREAGEGGPSLRLVWRETGGPPVEPPSAHGFGSRLIERGLAGELNGEAFIHYAPDGVVCTIIAPLSAG